MDWSKIVDFIHKTPPYSLAVAIVSGIILIAGNEAADWLGLKEYRAIVSVVFFVAIAVMAGQIFTALWNWGAKTYSKTAATSAVRKRLSDLTDVERSLLQEFALHKSRIIRLWPTNVGVLALVRDGIIHEVHAPTDNAKDDRRPFALADDAWVFIRENRTQFVKPKKGAA